MADSDSLRTGAKVSGSVSTLAITVAITAWMGKKLDEQFGTEPLLILGFSFFGFAVALYGLARALSENDTDDDDLPNDPS